MDEQLSELTERLQKIYGDRLVSLILYGSAVTGDYHPDYSDVNLLCVLSAVGPRELRDAEPVLRWWGRRGHPAPLFLSEAELAAATDCFPIEFIDMQSARRVLAGRDPLAGLEIDRSFYRARVEFELRAKLLRLRQKAAASTFDKPLLLRLMADSVSTFLVLARHALLLAGFEAPLSRRETAGALEARFALDPSSFLTLLDVREGKQKGSAVDSHELFARYLGAVEALVGAVDRLAR